MSQTLICVMLQKQSVKVKIKQGEVDCGMVFVVKMSKQGNMIKGKMIKGQYDKKAE